MTISTTRDQQFTVSEIIFLACVKSGMINEQQSVPISRASVCEKELDLLVSELVIEGIFPRDVQPYNLTLVAGLPLYDMPAYAFDVVDTAMYIPPLSVAPNITETPLFAVSRQTYQEKSSKLILGQPTQYYTNRIVEPVQVMLWPVPDTAQAGGFIRFQVHTLKSKNLGANTPDLERFWQDYLVHALASRLADNAGYTQQATRMGQLADQKKQLCKAYANERPNEQMYMAHYSPWRGR